MKDGSYPQIQHITYSIQKVAADPFDPLKTSSSLANGLERDHTINFEEEKKGIETFFSDNR